MLGRSGFSPAMIRTGSPGSVPGKDPWETAVGPLTHTCCIIVATVGKASVRGAPVWRVEPTPQRYRRRHVLMSPA